MTFAFSALLAITAASLAVAEDWPMWRYDAARSARTTQSLPSTLHLQWTRQLPRLKPAFRTKRIQFDAGYEPIILGQTLFVASSHDDSVTALDIASGRQRWQFYSDGPIRLAPVAWKQRVFFGSDDGYLYCLAADSGQLLWKYHAVPSNRKILGNGRLISVWPIRGGPVVQDGRLFFAAGVWPLEGVFLYCLNAETGQLVWRNDRCGYLFGQHPHGAESLGGITPQGYLVICDNELVVPCGQAVPARFDLATGKLLSFELPKPGRLPGGWFASADVRRGKVVLDADINRDLHEDKTYQGPGTPGVRTSIHVGDRSYRFSDPFPGVEGKVHSMLAGANRLFVVGVDGLLYCFGADKPEHVFHHQLEQHKLVRQPNAIPTRAKQVLSVVQARHGYAIVLGIRNHALLDALLTQTDFQIFAADSDQTTIAQLRQRFNDAGLYGTRIALQRCEPGELVLPPYVANVVIAEDIRWLPTRLLAEKTDRTPESNALLSRFELLRPYGGMALLRSLPDEQYTRFLKAVDDVKTFTIEQSANMTIVRRPRALPGAVNYTGDWTSRDQRVRAPLGVLWFDDTLGHFKRSPQPMFVDGVMVSYPKDWMAHHREGKAPPYSLLAPVLSDVYTGRVLAPYERIVQGLQIPERDRQRPQPNQYRPPYQKDAWKPNAPSAGTRVNPLTGNEEPRAFPKSYGCDGGVDYGYLYTMRSGTAAFYDKRLESGTCYISGPRSGCTNSIIPACGVLNVPYFYEGCTCSYPLPSGLALVPMPPQFEQWAAWGPGEATDIVRVGINFGAPGDRMAPPEPGDPSPTDFADNTSDNRSGNQTLWLDFPSIGGPSPEIAIQVEPSSAEYYYHHSLWMRGGTAWPWVAASGVQGASTIVVSGLHNASYTVRLSFAEPDHDTPGERTFDVALGGRWVLKNMDVALRAKGRMRGIVETFHDVPVDGTLRIDLKPQRGKTILSGIELIAQ